MRWIVFALLLTCCEAPKESVADHRRALARVLEEMAAHLGAVETAADWACIEPQLEQDYVRLARELVALDRLGAKAPVTESIELMQTKEGINEHLERIREMEGGIDWLRRLQRRAHTFLIDTEGLSLKT